jgi:small subunit ribosomal protein S4
LERKGAIPPGHHAFGRTRKLSEYGLELREKQKAKRMFGVTEKQFARYYRIASRKRGNTGESLMRLLETRLDNVVYRLGFALSRGGARQLVTHGHITINGQKVNIPSYCVKAEQNIAILGKMLDNTQVRKSLEVQTTLPGWLERKATVGKVLRLPKREEMEPAINEQLIVEYYSR